MRIKHLFVFLMFMIAFLLMGCQSISRRVISNLEYYGYTVELVEDEEELEGILFEEYVVHLYRIYDEDDAYLADMYEMESQDKLMEALESEGYQSGDFFCSKNMMLMLRSTETLDLLLRFYDNDPSKLTNK